MCGIFGVINCDGKHPVSIEKLDESIKLQYHRGPDKQLTELFNPHVGLAHARLSIIDLSDSANQPFTYDKLAIVFNGEIFNYVELKAELLDFGYEFRTESDTEVILAAYLKWGDQCVKRFNGMWAFAIYDKENETLFCSRDRFGIKPFYYSLHKQDFLFTSEIKSILNYYPELKRPNYDAIAAFCRESVGAENTESWFEGVLRLPPAHNLYLVDGKIEIKRYWDYPEKEDNSIKWDAAIKEYKRLFYDAINIRLRSDVPLGATLSGGLDSTSIVCGIEKEFGINVDAYTASFDGGVIDEYDVVKRLKEKFNFNSHRINVKYEDLLGDLTDIIYLIESGHSSPAIFPLNKVNEKAREKLIVVLEGQGADELLGGYIHAVFTDYLFDLIRKLKMRKAFKELAEFRRQWSFKSSILMFGRYNLPFWARSMYRRAKGIDSVYCGELATYTKRSAKIPKVNSKRTGSRLNKLLKEQHQSGLLKLLHYGDAVSMMYSLESRLPFMDYRLVEYSFKLPAEFKIKEGFGKYIHRVAMKDLLPEYVTFDRRKIGFDTPIAKELSENVKLRDRLLNGSVYDKGLFDKKTVQRFLDETTSKQHDHSTLLFRILTVQLWFDLFIDEITKPKTRKVDNLVVVS